MEENNRFIIVTKTLRKYGFQSKNGAILKTSLSNLTFTTEFDNKDDCKYFGNRILAIIDTKIKTVYIVDTSSVSSIARTETGYIVKIDCNLLFSDKYETLTRAKFNSTANYTTLFNETHYMFGAFNVYTEITVNPNTTNHSGIYVRPRTDWPFKRLCDFRDGNAVFMAIIEKNSESDQYKTFGLSSYPSGRDANTSSATDEGFRPNSRMNAFSSTSAQSNIGEYIALK